MKKEKEHMDFLKADIVKSVAEETNTPYARVQVVVNALADTIIRETAAGNSVKIPPLGTFKTSFRGERMANNPRTGEKIAVEAHNAVKFTPSSIFKGAVR